MNVLNVTASQFNFVNTKPAISIVNKNDKVDVSDKLKLIEFLRSQDIKLPADTKAITIEDTYIEVERSSGLFDRINLK